MAETVRIEGLEGLLESLQAMPKELVAKAGGPVAFGMRKGGNLIRDEARKRAPLGTSDNGRPYLVTQIITKRMSAKLARRAGAGEYFTVGVRLGKKKKYANTKRNKRMRRAGGLYQTEGWAYYWRFHEFGSKHQKARPFLTPAAEAKGPEASQVIAAEIRIGIDRIAKKHGWKG